jgi:hypothetical protein
MQKGIPPVALKCEGPNSFVIDSTAYIVGGGTISSMLNTVWKYNPIADTWTQKNNFPFAARCLGVAFSLCQKGYFGTGTDGNGITYQDDLWEYDPATDVWTQKTSFPGAGRQAAAYFTINGKAYVGTGVNHTTIFNNFYEYTPDNLCITGINDVSYKSVNLEVSPNPVSGCMIVKAAHLPALAGTVLKIMDSKGKIIKEINYPDQGTEIKINTKELSRGVYFLQLSCADIKLVRKIVIM